MSGSRVGQPRIWWSLAGLLTIGALLISGCSGGDSPGGSSGASAAKVTLEPGNGAKDVSPRTAAKVAVNNGTLSDVALTNADGKALAGKLADDKKSWTATELLGFGKSYSFSGSAVGADGKKVDVKGSFSTIAGGKQIRATVNPSDNAVVGIAMPIKVEFDAPVADRAAAQRALKVETSVPTEGAWAWLNDKEVHYRPKEFWKPNTKVSVRADLYAVDYGKGNFGKADLTTTFTIGRAQIVEANVRTHRLIVKQNGKEVMNFPASLGDEGNPDLRTKNGIYMVSEKHAVEKMDNPKYGYTNVMKKWAVRIANSGEFIHENNDNRANIGKRNTSHGCINLLESDAKRYYDSAIVGDPVIISGSAADMPAKYDTYDWRISWSQWLALSAIK